MKKIIYLFICTFILVGCKNHNATSENTTSKYEVVYIDNHDDTINVQNKNGKDLIAAHNEDGHSYVEYSEQNNEVYLHNVLRFRKIK